jgi:hypothetical protein
MLDHLNVVSCSSPSQSPIHASGSRPRGAPKANSRRFTAARAGRCPRRGLVEGHRLPCTTPGPSVVAFAELRAGRACLPRGVCAATACSRSVCLPGVATDGGRGRLPPVVIGRVRNLHGGPWAPRLKLGRGLVADALLHGVDGAHFGLSTPPRHAKQRVCEHTRHTERARLNQHLGAGPGGIGCLCPTRMCPFSLISSPLQRSAPAASDTGG